MSIFVMLRWIGILVIFAWILIGIWMLVSPDQDLPHPYLPGGAIVVIGSLTFAMLLGSKIAGRLLALLWGGFIAYDFGSTVIHFCNPPGSADVPSWHELLLSTARLLVFSVPCLLYVAKWENALGKYCIIMLPCALFILLALAVWKFAVVRWAIILVVMVLVALYLHEFFRDRKRGWRLNPKGYGHWIYEERIGSVWHGIRLECTSDHREPPILILLPTREAWKNFPSWSEDRHAEIMQRIVDRLNDPALTLLDPETNLAIEKSSGLAK